MNKLCNQALIGWKPVNERIPIARFHMRHAKVTIIQAHAPTYESDDHANNVFYNVVQETFHNTPRHDIKILSGDFNAQTDNQRTGMESMVGPFGIASKTNDNGKRFISF